MAKRPAVMDRFRREAPLCACGNLRKAVRAVTHLYDEALQPIHLRATQLAVLAHCSALGPVTMSHLAQETVTDRTTLTRNLQPLEKRGLVRIRPGKDRREREVRLTEAGGEILMRAYPLWRKAQAKVTHRLGRKRMGRLITDLAVLMEIGSGS